MRHIDKRHMFDDESYILITTIFLIPKYFKNLYLLHVLLLFMVSYSGYIIMKRVIKERVTSLSENDRSFDREFWDEVGHEGRFSAMWEMIREKDLIRGKDGSQPRLQRSVQNILHRES